MDGLRWLLLLIGLFVVAGVYLYTRRERDRKNAPEEAPPLPERLEPLLTANDSPESDPDGSQQDTEVTEAAAEESPVPQKVVTLRLVARNQGTLPGDELVLSMRGIGLRHGKFGIFHRYDGIDQDRVIFSAASLVEPGSFDLANIKDQRFPGISLFMVLPGPVDGPEGFDLMTAAGRALAEALQAELLDESGSTLSIQRERYLREEIIQFAHANQVA